MFAVLKTGGKQYKVASGDVLRVEKLAADPGETVQFNDVLMIGGEAPVLGTPAVSGAGVQAEVIDQIRGEKVIKFVKRRRKHGSQRTRGHRQDLTLVRVTDILSSGAGKSGVKAAIGTGSVPAAVQDAAELATEGPRAKPGNLLDAPRGGAADDLKGISGLGPKMEEALNKAGVYHLDQITGWNAAEAAYIDEELALHGRIERDDWAGQATRLLAGKE